MDGREYASFGARRQGIPKPAELRNLVEYAKSKSQRATRSIVDPMTPPTTPKRGINQAATPSSSRSGKSVRFQENAATHTEAAYPSPESLPRTPLKRAVKKVAKKAISYSPQYQELLDLATRGASRASDEPQPVPTRKEKGAFLEKAPRLPAHVPSPVAADSHGATRPEKVTSPVTSEERQRSLQNTSCLKPSSPPKHPLAEPRTPPSKRVKQYNDSRVFNLVSVDPSTPAVPNTPATNLLDRIERTPESLSPEEIAALFRVLKKEARRFAKRHFQFELSEAQKAAWPLHDLVAKYPALLLTTQYIADGSQRTWRRFFTEKIPRRSLAFGVLGEWFKHHVFGATCFGLPEDQVQELEDQDREYLHYDAFVRSKHRADLINDFLYGVEDDLDIFPGTDANERVADVDVAAQKLADELISVLEPLMAPPAFDPLGRSKDRASLGQATRYRTLLRIDLVRLIHRAAGLARSIRLTGHDGTIVRICPAVPKGSQFFHTAPFNCINKKMCTKTWNAPNSEHDKLRITMTCWGRVEMVTPTGLDVEQLALKEAELKANLPQMPHQAFSWEASKDYADVFAELPCELQDEEGRLGTESITIMDNDNKPLTYHPTLLRGAYVTYYPKISSHEVYCEWTPEPGSSVISNSESLDPKYKLSLLDAIAEARRQHGLPAVYNSRVQMWNTLMLLEPAFEWLALAYAIHHRHDIGKMLSELAETFIPEGALTAIPQAMTQVFEGLRDMVAHLELPTRQARILSRFLQHQFHEFARHFNIPQPRSLAGLGNLTHINAETIKSTIAELASHLPSDVRDLATRALPAATRLDSVPVLGRAIQHIAPLSPTSYASSTGSVAGSSTSASATASGTPVVIAEIEGLKNIWGKLLKPFFPIHLGLNRRRVGVDLVHGVAMNN